MGWILAAWRTSIKIYLVLFKYRKYLDFTENVFAIGWRQIWVWGWTYATKNLMKIKNLIIRLSKTFQTQIYLYFLIKNKVNRPHYILLFKSLFWMNSVWFYKIDFLITEYFY